MTDSEFDRECITAARIIDQALDAAFDDAFEAGISGESFVAAILLHVSTVLIESFEQTPDEIGLLAKQSAAAHAAARHTRVLH